MSCDEKKERVPLLMDSLASMRNPQYVLDGQRVRDNLYHIMMADKDRIDIDRHVRRRYRDGADMLWVSRNGVTAKADTVLAWLDSLEASGFRRGFLSCETIRHDLATVRSLAFAQDEGQDDAVNTVYARLEYNLTKAYLRYVIGQRFGFVDPVAMFNRVDKTEPDSMCRTYRVLYDISTAKADAAFIDAACRAVACGSVDEFMRLSRPDNPMYDSLAAIVSSELSPSRRRLCLVNMERCRWRQQTYPELHSRRVVVNLPSQQVVATDSSETLTMRVAFGALSTKTPLLTGVISRMDFNPQWVIPKSIVKSSVCVHAGDPTYFTAHNYIIIHRPTGKEVDPEHVTHDMLLSKDYSVVQRGGEGNSLGRVIFRFDNSHAIYMHDTSSPTVFARSLRAVSHGCIRLERPFDMAVFLLGDKDEKTLEKIRYTMTVDDRQKDDVETPPVNRSMLLRSLKVEPQVPVFITYYTLLPDGKGGMESLPDIYGYDELIYDKIRDFIR